MDEARRFGGEFGADARDTSAITTGKLWPGPILAQQTVGAWEEPWTCWLRASEAWGFEELKSVCLFVREGGG